MVKLSLTLMVLLVSFFLPQSLLARGANSSNASFFAGTATGLGWPKTFRFSWKELELGTYPTSVGMVKVFPLHNKYYAHFGLGMSQQGTNQLGFLAGVGYHYYLGWMVGLKADWSSFGGVGGYQSSDVSLGLTLNF